MLKTLNDTGNMRHGMISLLDETSGDLLVTACMKIRSPSITSVTNRAKAWSGPSWKAVKPLVLRRISDEGRFLDRLGVYDMALPFIGVPISIGDHTVGRIGRSAFG